jgi:hypothetical protein
MGVKPYSGKGFQPSLIPERLGRRFRKGEFIFVSDVGDLFGQWVLGEWIQRGAGCDQDVAADHLPPFLLLGPNLLEENHALF